MIRILIVEDEPIIRLLIKTIIEIDEKLTIVGEAENGKQAVEMAETLRPDIITMDLRIPEIDGLEATRKIMEKAPCPIIMVSSFTTEETQETLSALNEGAVDFIAKVSSVLPNLDIGHIDSMLVKKIHMWQSYTQSEREQKRKENIAHLRAFQLQLLNSTDPQ